MKIWKRALNKIIKEELNSYIDESIMPHEVPTYELVINCLKDSAGCLAQAALAYAQGEMEAVLDLECVKQRMQCIRKAQSRSQF